METKNFIFEEYYLHLVNFKKTAKFKYFATPTRLSLINPQSYFSLS